jgi:hypothetical protein
MKRVGREELGEEARRERGVLRRTGERVGLGEEVKERAGV